MNVNVDEPVQKIIPLVEMGHPQPRTPMQNNNLAAHLVVTNYIQPIITKAMDMNFHWLMCREIQDNFRYYWISLKQNLSD